MKLTLTAAGAKLTADGSLTRPLQGKGYNLAVSGTVPDASALTPLLQGTVPPPLHDVTFAAKIADTGATLPEFSTLTLHVGASDLSAQMPGLMLDKLDIDAPKVDQPMKVDAAAKLGDTAHDRGRHLRTAGVAAARRQTGPVPGRRHGPGGRERPPRRRGRSRTSTR